MIKEPDNVWKRDARVSRPAPFQACGTLQARLRRAEAEVSRLTRCVQLKEQQLSELRKVLAHSATLHYAVEDRQQRELESLRMMIAAEEVETRSGQSWSVASPGSVVARLPYVTTTLSVLIDAMFTFWAECDHEHPPKSSTVAHAIDERLGLSAQSNGEASRSGQAYASAIRPDWVKEADNRHHGRPFAGR
jgi:hypothetical protein